MPINILMPALSPTMEKGNLAKWLKKEGDKVKSGDVIAEIETDKATMEVEAVDEGTMAKIVVPEGTQDVPVNDVIAVLAGDGEDVKAAGAGAASAPPKAAAPQLPRQPTAAKPPRPDRSPPRGDASCASAQDEARLQRSASAPPRARRREARAASQRSRPHILLAAGPPPCQGSRHRACAHQRFRSAWPRDRARCRGSQIRQGAESARGRSGRRAERLRLRCRTSRSARCSKTAATR